MEKQEGKKVRNDENKQESLLVTKESLCATIAIFSFLAFLILCTGPYMFGDFGLAVYSFLAGAFGYFAYPIMAGIIYLSVMGLIGKKLVKNKRAGVCIALTLFCLAFIVHIALTFSWTREGYLAKCFLAGENFPNATVTGWLGGLVVFGVSAVMSNVGAIVLFALFAAFFVYLTVLSIKNPAVRKEKPAKAVKKAEEPRVEAQPTYQPDTPMPAYVKQGAYQGIAPLPQITPNPNVGKKPQITIQDEREGQGYVHSPFGRMEQLRNEPEQPREPQSSHEILFGGDPVENFQKNGMFDPKSSVNKRSNEPIMPTPPFTPTVDTHTFVPSYTDSYQNSVNDEEESYRPATTFTRKTEPTPAFEEENTREEFLEPLPYVEEEKPIPQETISYPTFEEEIPPVEQTCGEERFGFGRDVVEEEQEEEEKPFERQDYKDIFSPSNPRLFGEEESTPSRGSDISERGFGSDELTNTRGRMDDFGVGERGSLEEEDRGGRSTRGVDIFDEPEDDPYTLRAEENSREAVSPREEEKPREEEIDISGRGSNNTTASYLGLSDRGGDRGLGIPQEEKKPEPKKPRVIRPYKRVPLDDFDCRDVEPSQNDVEVEETKQNIIATLEDFKITGATIASVTFGPTVTRYNVALPRSISPRKVVALDQSIAISLHSSGVNIYPNYEDGVVSIEVPNKERQFVQLGCMLSGNTFVNAPAGSLMFAMGKNVANAKIYGDISKMIHLLVAGSSGSGKSVFLGALIISMIYKYSPEELRLILIDPKKTEFVLYNNLPHLMINEIITEVNKAVQSLNWAIGEMNRRYSLFEQMSRSGKYVVNLDQYNEHLEKNERLPKIVIIIDELADLMLAAKKDIEDKIQNLTQKARAAGIHLIVATQRPSADVITGVIKSNLSTRIAFAVASDVDSRVILDQTGAQKLLGKGDFLYSMPGINTPVRVQSAFISPSDSQKVVNFIKANNEAYYDEEATAYINNTRVSSDDSPSGEKGSFDPMCIEALRHVILSGSASISMIQRKCSAGYNRAGKIIEWMEDMGFISPFDGARARKVLITKEQFEAQFGPL